MAFTAPTLTTSLTTTGYASELNTNFSSINTAFQQIQTELGGSFGGTPSLTGSTNFGHLFKLIDPGTQGPSRPTGGVVGEDAFNVAFSTDHETMTISHPSLAGESHCAFIEAGTQVRWYTSSDASTTTLTSLVSVDGTYDICVGVSSVGSPNLEYVVAKVPPTGTDYEEAGMDLLLYTFKYTKASSTYTVSQLRREAPVLPAADAFKRVYEFEHPLTINLQDPLAWSYNNVTPKMNTEGFVPTVGGFIIPWDCEVTKAYVMCETTGSQTVTDGYRLDLFKGQHQDGISTPNIDDGQILNGPVILDHDMELHTLSALDPPCQLSAGDFVQPAITDNQAGQLSTDPPTGLTMTLLLRPHYLGVYEKATTYDQ